MLAEVFSYPYTPVVHGNAYMNLYYFNRDICHTTQAISLEVTITTPDS